LLLLLLITLVIYLRTLGFSFLYDDTSQIAQNPTIRSWSYLPQYFTQHIWGYSNVLTNLYRPIFLINLRICHALFGLNPLGWHAFALFVHLVNICLVFIVARKIFGKTNDWTALTAAAIFAIHPIQLETVAWVSGMTDSLMAVPLLLGFWSYLQWRDSGRAQWIALCAFCFLIALLTKESGAVLLLLIFAYELTLGRARPSANRAPVSRGFAMLTAITLAYFVVRWLVLHTPIGRPAASISLSTAIFTIPLTVLRYLRMLLLPYDMSAFLPSTYITTASLTHFVLPLLALVLILFALDFWARRTNSPEIAFASLWLFLGLSPVLNLRMMQPDDFIHIRFLYLSSIGFSFLIAIALRQLLREPKLRLAAAVALVSLLGAGAFAQIDFWHDNVSLYQRGVAIAPNNPVPKTNLASEYMRANRDDEALALLDDVLRHHPDFWTANYNRGSLAYKRQDWPATAEYMDRTIKNHGLEVDAYIYRGFALMKLGRLPVAEQSIRDGIALRPNAHSYHFVLGLVLRQEQRWTDALAAFEDELKINPRDQNSAIHVADLKHRLGK
jgi:protein O-mannosyl-transferase